MKGPPIVRFVLAAFLITAFYAHAQPSPGKAPNFRLLDTRGFSHELDRHADAAGNVLVAWPSADPGEPDAAKAIAALAAEYKAANIRFFAIDPAPRGDEAAARARIESAPDPNLALLAGAKSLLGSLGMRQGPPPAPGADAVPVLRDTTQAVSTALAFRAPFEALIIAPKDRTILFRGPLQSPALRDALLALSKGELAAPIAFADVTNGPMPLADWPAAPNYASQVAPIIQSKCNTCHAAEGVAPIAFTSYDKARNYADMIEEVVLAKRMPPWHADPAYSHFANDRSLSDDEQRTLIAWASAGAPRGEGDDPLPQAPAAPHAQWKLGEPDIVIGMDEPHALPAEGVLPYYVVTIPTNFTQDTWVRGIEVRAGNPKVVHHALIFIDYPANLKAREPHVGGGTGGYFAGFVPGAEPYFFPENTGKFIPAGASFIFQIHYVTTGKPEQDQTQMGLYLCKEPPLERMETEAASNTMFQIPPGMRDVPATADDGIWTEVKLWGLSPHMHYRGSRFKYTAKYNDGNQAVLLSVPNYSFDWQTMYHFAEPITMPARTRIVCEGAFDNSVTNPYNPDPTDTVRFGDQTFQEMFIGYYEYSAPVEVFERAFRQRERHMAKMKAEFDATNPGVSSGPPFTLEELIGTTWRDDKWTFSFKENNEILVNSFIKGEWKLENNRVIIDVYGEHFELDVLGKGLFFNGNYPIERVK